MMTFIEKIQLIERVDQLIRLKATGSPEELADHLAISERSIYLLIDTMRTFGASIYYCTHKRSYCYEQEIRFIFGFIHKEGKQIFGGFSNFNISLQNSCSGKDYLYFRN